VTSFKTLLTTSINLLPVPFIPFSIAKKLRQKIKIPTNLQVRHPRCVEMLKLFHSIPEHTITLSVTTSQEIHIVTPAQIPSEIAH
jgi:hypothetical protein